MKAMLIEMAIILALLVVNGVFAMTEIAIVAGRKGRLRALANGRNGRARMALELAEWAISPRRMSGRSRWRRGGQTVRG